MKEILLDDNGKLSFSRIISCILIFSYLIGMFYLLYKKQEFIDIPLQLAGLIATIYGLNKFGSKGINNSNN